MNQTVSGALSGNLGIIPSKSAAHRAVLLASLAYGETVIEPLQLPEDISAPLACPQQLGLTRGSATAPASPGYVRMRIMGRSKNEEKRNTRTLDCGESGSTLRFMLPLALDGRGPVRFLGRGRLMQRPLNVYEDLFKAQGMFWQLRGNELTVDGYVGTAAQTFAARKQLAFIPLSQKGDPVAQDDVNADGDVNISDATELQKVIAELITIDPAILSRAVKGYSGSVSIDDVTAVQRRLAELD